MSKLTRRRLRDRLFRWPGKASKAQEPSARERLLGILHDPAAHGTFAATAAAVEDMRSSVREYLVEIGIAEASLERVQEFEGQIWEIEVRDHGWNARQREMMDRLLMQRAPVIALRPGLYRSSFNRLLDRLEADCSRIVGLSEAKLVESTLVDIEVSLSETAQRLTTVMQREAGFLGSNVDGLLDLSCRYSDAIGRDQTNLHKVFHAAQAAHTAGDYDVLINHIAEIETLSGRLARAIQTHEDLVSQCLSTWQQRCEQWPEFSARFEKKIQQLSKLWKTAQFPAAWTKLSEEINKYIFTQAKRAGMRDQAAIRSIAGLPRNALTWKPAPAFLYESKDAESNGGVAFRDWVSAHWIVQDDLQRFHEFIQRDAPQPEPSDEFGEDDTDTSWSVPINRLLP